MAMTWKEHPVLKPPTAQEIARMNPGDLLDLHRLYHEAIEYAKKDPIRYGFECFSWPKANKALEEYNEVMVLGGNRSSKTCYGAQLVVRAATENYGGHIVCFSQNMDTSVKIQQKAVYEYLPLEIRKRCKTEEGYINYSMQNGFTNGSFIVPETRTIVDFKTYTQYVNSPIILEGFEYGANECGTINLGAWLDEYLMDAALVNTLRFRLSTRNSKLLLTFTPIDGYTAFVADYLRGAQTLEMREAALLNNEKLPVLQHSPERNARIVYFHTDQNPFGGYARMAQDLKNRPREEILTRAYGIPIKSITTLFPMFNKEVNVLSAEKFPDVTGREFTRYMVIDPAGNKNWFMVWIAVDSNGTWWVYREWPSRDESGQWAKPGKGGWKYAEASKGLGFDVPRYAEIIREMENDEVIFERIIDVRAGSTKYSSQDKGLRNLIMDLAEEELHCQPSSGAREMIGIQKMQELFYYDASRPIDAGNHPKIYIHESCGNLVESLVNYGAIGKEDEPLKDPIDTLRYAREAEIEHYTPDSFRGTRRTWGY